ncbi:SulP family inorganic anion transporter [Thermoleptolyngbya sp.]
MDSRLSLRDELQPKNLSDSLVAGLVGGLVSVLTGIVPMAALVFSGELEPFLAAGIAICLFSSVVVGAVMALRSSCPELLAYPVAEELATLSVTTAGVMAALPADLAPEAKFISVVAAIALSSLLTGVCLLVMGQCRLGELIRFLPYPVVGGFLAGLGVLLSQGSLRIMTNQGLSLATLPSFFSPDLLLRWVPGLLFAIALFWLTRRFSHPLLIPGCFAVAMALFYGGLAATGTSVQAALDQGWMLGPFPSGGGWRPFGPLQWAQANWPAVLSQLPSMATLVLITALSLLLVSTGIELATEQDLDLNRELKSVGIASLLSGLGGGMVGSHAVTTLLVSNMGVRSRAVGIFASLLYLVVLLFGLSMLSYFPRFMIGGALLFIGLQLLYQWVVTSWAKLPRLDYGLIWLILIIVALKDFLTGVGVGLLIASLLFILSYSRQRVVKYVRSGASYQSHAARSLQQQQFLRQEGQQIQIFSLQGYLFFGTATALLKQVQARLQDVTQAPLQFLILDFRLVTGLDASAALSFAKMQQVARKHGFRLLFANLPPLILSQLQQGGVLETPPAEHTVFPDVDRAVEWCEDQLFADVAWRRRRSLPLLMQLHDVFPDESQASEFAAYLETQDVAAGTGLFRAGDRANGLYWIESGQVTLWIDLPGDQQKRLQTLGQGMIVGEDACYHKAVHTVTAIADMPSTLHWLSAESLSNLRQRNPQLALRLMDWVMRLLSEQVIHAKAEIQELLQ